MRPSIFLLVCFALAADNRPGPVWQRHTIDDTSKGADGVRLIDVNGDGRQDVATGWEQGGVVRLYFNPSRVDSMNPWRQVTVGRVGDPEDAVFADLDSDLAFDVVSACEGKQKAIFVHWAPKDEDRYWYDDAWTTAAIPASLGRMWMFVVPLQVDGRNGVDLIAGGKGPGAELGWFEAPANPRDLAAWKWHPLRPAGWIMSIIPADLDRDGDMDILFSDRKGGRSGVFWLENPGVDSKAAWREHPIGSAGSEVMFVDFDQGRVLAAVKPNRIEIHSRAGERWSTAVLETPDWAGTVKAVRAGDVNQDGVPDVVVSFEQAAGDKSGLIYRSGKTGAWHDIGGPEGVKYDLVELIDLDGDTDLDILTTEEVDGLGVVWYENPGRAGN